MMKTNLMTMCAVMAVLAIGGVPSANAAVSYDQDVTPDVIFGSGNANGGWTVDESTVNNMELGLRAKLQFNDNNLAENTFNSNGDGTYTFNAGLAPTGFGFAPGSTSTAVWNFEWSVNTDRLGTIGHNLDNSGFTYELLIDFDPAETFDPSASTTLSFDPFYSNRTVFPDHAIGNNSTGNGGGTVAANAADYRNLIYNNNVAQNSWNMEFFDDSENGLSFDGRTVGTYDFVLIGRSSNGNELARTSMQVNVVPEPATMGLLALGGLALIRRRRAA